MIRNAMPQQPIEPTGEAAVIRLLEELRREQQTAQQQQRQQPPQQPQQDQQQGLGFHHPLQKRAIADVEASIVDQPPPTAATGSPWSTMQVHNATGLLAKIRAVFNIAGTHVVKHTGAPLQALDTFASFDFMLCLPNLVDLEEQTVKRMLHDLPWLGDEKAARARVLRGPSAAATSKFNAFAQRVERKQDTLFLFMHDEAHFAANKPRGDDTTEAFAARCILDPRLQSAPNVIFLLVSATVGLSVRFIGLCAICS